MLATLYTPCLINKAIASYAERYGFDSWHRRHRFVQCYSVSGAQWVLPYIGWRVTASQLDLQSLTPLSVIGCSRLQLGVAHWATSVTLGQVGDELPSGMSSSSSCSSRICLIARAKKERTIQYGYRKWGTHARVFSPNTCAWEQQEWNKMKKHTKVVRRQAWVWKKAKRARKKEVPTAYHILTKIQ